MVNVAEQKKREEIKYITVTGISRTPFSYRAPADTLLEHVFVYFLEKRLGRDSTGKDRKENCLVRMSQLNDPLPLDKTLAQCHIQDQERLESRNESSYSLLVRLLSSIKTPEKTPGKITLYYGTEKVNVFSAPPIMSVRTVFKYFLRGYLDHPLTSVEEKEWYLARVTADNRPIPLDKTVQECGFKEGECFICKRWEDLNKKNRKEKEGKGRKVGKIKPEVSNTEDQSINDNLNLGYSIPPVNMISVRDIISGDVLTNLSLDTLIATVFDSFLMKQGDQERMNRSEYSLVRATDGNNPLPLEKTLGECGIGDGEMLASRRKRRDNT